VGALVFDPNPIEVLRPAQAPARLTTFAQKRDLLLACGADEVHRLEPSAALLSESPEQFVNRILGLHQVVGVVEGPDFRFGKGRAGDVSTLATLGAKLGFTVDVVDPVSVTLNDHAIAPARSTIVRWLLGHGRVDDAARVLGHPYTMRGEVVRGDQVGRTIGFPTANLRSVCLAPGDGVYAGRARLEDGREFVAAISVGTKPTFGERQRAVEAVLLGPGSADAAALTGLAEYGWSLDLEFHRWVRDQVRFESVESLIGQLKRDCAAVVDVMDGVQARTGACAPG
jgi:riboflavin kinase/FMN adenylyltransferase